MSKRKNLPDLMPFVSYSDVDLVLKRLPDTVLKRLRDVFIRPWSLGVRQLGYVTKRGRRDIILCGTLPVRLSLGRFLTKPQRPMDFGAEPRCQWTPWAIRLFLLYDVLLHELGHLKIVNHKSKEYRRKFAYETIAQEFANYWRYELWSTSFTHKDPIQNPPCTEEITFLSVWRGLNKLERFRFVNTVLKAPHIVRPDLDY